jgi:VanZ family protein
MNKTWKRKALILFSWTLVLLWMMLIFCLSSQPVRQSDALSKGIAISSLSVAEKVNPELHLSLKQLNSLLRKNAHFFVYLVFGILVINAKRRSGLKGRKWFFLALFLCVLYAVSDEIHQLYVPGRGGQLRDILIDSAGVLAGSALYKMGGKIRSRKPAAIK